MSNAQRDAVWRGLPAQLDALDLLVAVRLADRVNDAAGGLSFLKTETIATDCRLSQRQVFRIMQRLRSSGVLLAAGATAGGVRQYRINLAMLQAGKPDALASPIRPEPTPPRPVGVMVRQLADRKALR